MVEMAVATAKPAWVDLASSDPAKAGAFYADLLGWEVADPDPAYGGYVMARLGGKDVAGIGPKQMAEQPTAWSVYIGTPDADALSARVIAAGGAVIVPPFPVGGQGRMAVYQDPAGAFISAWQPMAMAGFQTAVPGAFAWAELSSRGIDVAVRFYTTVFGWTTHVSDLPDGSRYTEFHADGQSIAGGMAMNPMVPAEMPSYWLAYFAVEDVDATFARVLELGGHEMLSPVDFTGGRLAIVSDPEGAAFGLLRMR
jgi:predicted enzyme related to lactoylglutathione lyase